MKARPAPDDVAGRFELQAFYCDAMGAPLYASMARAAADDYRAGGTIAGFFEAHPSLTAFSTIGVRLMAAVHYDALSGAAPEVAAHFPSCGGDGDAVPAWVAVRAWIGVHSDEIARRCQSAPQTNEAARSVPLLAGALAMAARARMPLRLLDVGSSAGLNARLDCYRYEGNRWAWGDPRSPLVLCNREKGGTPAHLDAALTIRARAACDLHPLNIASEADRTTLRSYVWADQLERFERLNRAMEAASAVPLTVDEADMFEWIPRHAAPQRGLATVVMHSVVGEHLRPALRQRLFKTVESQGITATPDAPFGWLRMEQEGDTYGTRLTYWPGAEETPIATSDGHAQNIQWSSPPLGGSW